MASSSGSSADEVLSILRQAAAGQIVVISSDAARQVCRISTSISSSIGIHLCTVLTSSPLPQMYERFVRSIETDKECARLRAEAKIARVQHLQQAWHMEHHRTARMNIENFVPDPNMTDEDLRKLAVHITMATAEHSFNAVIGYLAVYKDTMEGEGNGEARRVVDEGGFCLMALLKTDPETLQAENQDGRLFACVCDLEQYPCIWATPVVSENNAQLQIKYRSA